MRCGSAVADRLATAGTRRRRPVELGRRRRQTEQTKCSGQRRSVLIGTKCPGFGSPALQLNGKRAIDGHTATGYQPGHVVGPQEHPPPPDGHYHS